MNFNISEINNWYKTEAGKINQDLVVDSLNNIILDRYDRSILYIGPNDITKKIMERDKSFNSFFVSFSAISQQSYTTQKKSGRGGGEAESN